MAFPIANHSRGVDSHVCAFDKTKGRFFDRFSSIFYPHPPVINFLFLDLIVSNRNRTKSTRLAVSLLGIVSMVF